MSSPDEELVYLSEDFDPASLTVPRLRSILVAHNVPYPSSAKKADLIDIFTSSVVPQSRRIISRSRSKRTSKGITDVPSSQEGTVNGNEEAGSSAMPPPPVPETPRRRSRKSVRGSEETGGEQAAPRSSARTPGRRSSSKHARASDAEAPAEAVQKRPAVRRPRKSAVEPAIKAEEPEHGRDDSYFSTDNPFQSGSSPLSASRSPSGEGRKSAGVGGARDGQRRKSGAVRRRTEEPRLATPIKQEDGAVVPSSRRFEFPVSRVKKQEEDADGIEAGEEFTPEEQLELVRERARNGETDILPPRRRQRPQRGGISKSAPWVVLLTLLGGYATWFRREKLEIGYCGVGRPETALSNVQIPEWASVLQPQCEPCPQHAYCYAGLETRCEPDFVLTPHPLSLGGLVPLPPTCEPDGEKARRVKAVADRAVEELRERRAKWECGDLVDESGKETPAVEIDEEGLKEEVGKKRRRGLSQDEFEELWKGAVGEMLGREEVVSEVDGRKGHGHRTFTSTSLARLSLACSLRRSARQALARYRIQLGGLVALALLAASAQYQLSSLRNVNKRVPDLVSLTLDRLAHQAAAHAADPRGVPEAWISVAQLRDDVLRDEFSAARREKLWSRVRRVVECNANVRASVREGRGGDVGRVWEWIGSVGALEDGRREGGRVSFGGNLTPGTGERALNSPAVGTPTEMVQQGKWEEGRPIY